MLSIWDCHAVGLLFSDRICSSPELSIKCAGGKALLNISSEDKYMDASNSRCLFGLNTDQLLVELNLSSNK